MALPFQPPDANGQHQRVFILGGWKSLRLMLRRLVVATCNGGGGNPCEKKTVKHPGLKRWCFTTVWVIFWEQGPGRLAWDEDDVATRMIFVNNFLVEKRLVFEFAFERLPIYEFVFEELPIYEFVSPKSFRWKLKYIPFSFHCLILG